MKNIHVLPTDKPSKIGQSIFDKSLHFNPIFYELEKERVIPQNIYITSDEKVKEGDWVLSFLEDEIYGTYFKIEENHFYCGFDFEEDFKKIILTTDPDLIKDGVQAIDDEFLEWFVKNPSCESADIKTENICARCYSNDLNDCWSAKECSDGKFDKIKYKIIIPKKEPILGIDFEMSIDDEGMCVQIPIIKQETLEEAAENYVRNESDDTLKLVSKYSFKGGTKWQAERMYSEEEVLKILYKSHNTESTSIIANTLKKWFEQFKKKV